MHTADYVKRKYKDAIVVFDGYSATNTKGVTHQRRAKGKTSMTVTFTAEMRVTTKKDQFLANKENKQRFIFMLSEELQKMYCETHHASGDADLLIVLKAVQSAATTTTVLVGDDTDLIVLLASIHMTFSFDSNQEDNKKTPLLEHNRYKAKTWSLV